MIMFLRILQYQFILFTQYYALNVELSLNTSKIAFYLYLYQMGNKNTQGLPSVIAKNWSQIQENSDVFKSKLTSEYVREFTIRVTDPQIIQQFKSRMKETNPYICRIAFYHHISNNIYHVYSDQNRNRPFVHNLQQWKSHKHHIIQAFLSLTKKYGYTHVCNQMIGVDFSGQIKVWINPDPLSNIVWSPCRSETQMIADILNVCKQIDEDSQNRIKKSINQEYLTMFVGNKPIINRNQTIQFHKSNSKNDEQILKADLKNYTPKKLKFISSISKTNQKHDEETKNTFSNFNTKSQNEKKELGQLNSEQVLPSSNPQTPEQQQQMTWERTRTESFTYFLQKKNRRYAWTDNYIKPPPKFFKLNKQIKENNYSLEPATVKKKSKGQQKLIGKIYENQIENTDRKYERGNNKQKKIEQYGREKASQSTDKFFLNQKNRTHGRKCSSIEKNVNIQRSLPWKSFQQMKKQQKLINNQQKLSNKLINVANIPVKEERQSQVQLALLETQDELRIKNQKTRQGNFMSISQQFMNFFDEQQKRQYMQIQLDINKKSILYEDFRNEVNNLLDD